MNIWGSMKTMLQTSSPELVRAIHAAGERIQLVSKGPIRYWYETSMSQAAVLELATKVDAGWIQVSPSSQLGTR